MLGWPFLVKKDYLLTIDDAIMFLNRKGAVLLDVRLLHLFEEGHIPQAKHCHTSDLLLKSGQLIKDKLQLILIISEEMKEAALARSKLLELGYLNVFVISGGMFLWKDRGLPVLRKGDKN